MAGIDRLRALIPTLLHATLLALFAFEWLVLLTRSFGTGMGQDFTTLYVAALAWRHGLDPYAATGSAAGAVHLAATLGVRYQGELELPALLALAAPLTLLPPRAAFFAYALMQQAIALSGVCLLFPARQRRSVSLLALASAPVFLVCYYGQAGALVAGAVALAWWARRHERPFLLGLCVGLALLKPQLGACVALPLLWGAPRPRARQLAGLAAGLATLLALSLAVVGPGGLPAYLRLARAFGTSAQAAKEAAADGLGLAALPHGLPWLAAVVLLVVGAGVIVRRAERAANDAEVAAACVLLVLALPYSHQYDSVALLPALGVAWQARPSRGMALVACLVLSLPLVALLTTPPPFRPLPLALLLWIAICAAPLGQRGLRRDQLPFGLAGRRAS